MEQHFFNTKDTKESTRNTKRDNVTPCVPCAFLGVPCVIFLPLWTFYQFDLSCCNFGSTPRTHPIPNAETQAKHHQQRAQPEYIDAGEFHGLQHDVV